MCLELLNALILLLEHLLESSQLILVRNNQILFLLSGLNQLVLHACHSVFER